MKSQLRLTAQLCELSETAMTEAFGAHIIKIFNVLLSGENFGSEEKFNDAIERFMRGFSNGLRAYSAVMDELEVAAASGSETASEASA
jgi:hypothetical protein